ncbi:MAG: hypothetical protein CME69_09620 [Halobacteriovorax sp.]|nr:hypothetical protein [Halobacteriovorax sp.]
MSNISMAQSIIDAFTDNEQQEVAEYDLTEETVLKHSISKRIYLLTNEENSFAEGDYVTMLLGRKPVVRGLIAKNTKKGAAFKVTKVYSGELFNAIVPQTRVQIIRGDDSFFRLKKPEQKEEEVKIESEEDLFDETDLLDENEYEEESKGGSIKNDNMIFFGFGYAKSFNPQSFTVDGSTATASGGDETNAIQLNGSYAYQMIKNVWIEGVVGRHDVSDWPHTGLQTTIWEFTGRIKYLINGPAYTFFLPYIGFQIKRLDSPSAGSDAEGIEQAQKVAELQDVAEAEDQTVAIGVTFLRRLVPGWFIKADIGTDILAFGLALEF